MTTPWSNLDMGDKVQALKCQKCGKLHPFDADTFLTFYGNVCVGIEGGIIGNNLNKEGKVISRSIYCRTEECLQSVLLQHIDFDKPFPEVPAGILEKNNR